MPPAIKAVFYADEMLIAANARYINMKFITPPFSRFE